jgi:hypothetical protein
MWPLLPARRATSCPPRQPLMLPSVNVNGKRSLLSSVASFPSCRLALRCLPRGPEPKVATEARLPRCAQETVDQLQDDLRVERASRDLERQSEALARGRQELRMQQSTHMQDQEYFVAQQQSEETGRLAKRRDAAFCQQGSGRPWWFGRSGKRAQPLQCAGNWQRGGPRQGHSAAAHGSALPLRASQQVGCRLHRARGVSWPSATECVSRSELRAMLVSLNEVGGVARGQRTSLREARARSPLPPGQENSPLAVNPTRARRRPRWRRGPDGGAAPCRR